MQADASTDTLQTPHSSTTLQQPPPPLSPPPRIRRSSLHLSPAWTSEESPTKLYDLSVRDKHLLRLPSLTLQPRGNNVALEFKTAVLQDQDEEDDYPDDEDNPDEDELLPVAFFPLLQQDLQDTQSEDNDDKKEYSGKDDNDTDDTVSSDVSIPGSLYSDHTAGDVWEQVPSAPPDAILGMAQAYKVCDHPNKVNLAVGAYRDDQGHPKVLDCVHQAEYLLWKDKNSNKEYLPIEGDSVFLQYALQFAYGPDVDLDHHIAAIQSLSGTGALRVGATFLAQFWPRHPICVPHPTWPNHVAIFQAAGLKVKHYRYWNADTKGLHVEGWIADLQRAPTGSIVLLHACAHNPTGCDPTIDQWKAILSVCSKRQHVLFWDAAYLGFASGNVQDDAQVIRYALSQHLPMLLAQSFAKNFGLYGERVGCLSVVCGSAAQRLRIVSELKSIVRPMYSSPPKHGAAVVRTILENPELRDLFVQECHGMAQRIAEMRQRLVQALDKIRSKDNNNNNKIDWSFLQGQIGMFAYTGLTVEQCQRLTSDYGIFLPTNGRLSMAGLNASNVDYVARALDAVTRDDNKVPQESFIVVEK